MNNFLEDLPHFYREYNHAHVEIINQMNDFDECVRLLDKFLPYVDNWEISDGINPKIFKKHPEEVLMLARRWMRSEHEFTQRVGILMMMKHFLDERFSSDFLEEVVEAAGGSEKFQKRWKVGGFLRSRKIFCGGCGGRF
ncbi:DNA alkylation repair protein [Candidatus Saccharibacteria bacterium]|nr:DNA alkylation repair protein [Candidatus Saccharibacteria bacterium]